MKILIYKWKAYNQKDIEQALIRRGHKVDGFWREMANFEKDDEFEAELVRRLEGADATADVNVPSAHGKAGAVAAADVNVLDTCGKVGADATADVRGGRQDAPVYDVVFSVNYFPLISDICERYVERGLKYVAWTCDSPLSTMYHQSIFNKCNYVFVFDKVCFLEFEKMGARVFHLPLAAAVERTDEMLGINGIGDSGLTERTGTAADEPKRTQGYRHDVTFIGSMYRKNSYDEIVDMLPDYVRGYFDALMKMQMEIYGENYIDDMLTADIIDELNKHFNIEKSSRSFSNLSLIFSTTVLGFKIAQMERYKLINALSRYFKVSVYTDDENADFALAENLGPADYWSESPLVFNESKINLNFTVRNIRSGIPLRIWDILAAGGFCITNFQMELPLYFKNGLELVWFEDEKDLIEKVRYYLEHDEERIAIARNGCRRVKELHSYDVRLGIIEQAVDT